MGCNCGKNKKLTNNVSLVPKIQAIQSIEENNDNRPPSLPINHDTPNSPLSEAWKNFKNTGKNLINIAKDQPNPIKWFKDGLSGLIKCIDGQTIYSDEDIQKNREVCRKCPYSTKDQGNLTLTSQCMAPDPKNNNVPCGCIIVCKTQVDKCPLEKWVTIPMTIKST